MNRRDLIAGLAAMTVAWPAALPRFKEIDQAIENCI